jgi:hypothetical protein
MNEKTPMTDDRMNERCLRSIAKHQLGIKCLTGAALALWLIAMLSSVFLVWAYFLVYLPKERQILQNFEKEYQAASPNAVASGESERQRVGKHQITFVMTRAVGVGMVSTAACVAVLSAGMFATIVLVIWNRRVTLRQISASLTQISGQLKELEMRA